MKCENCGEEFSEKIPYRDQRWRCQDIGHYKIYSEAGLCENVDPYGIRCEKQLDKILLPFGYYCPKCNYVILGEFK